MYTFIETRRGISGENTRLLQRFLPFIYAVKGTRFPCDDTIVLQVKLAVPVLKFPNFAMIREFVLKRVSCTRTYMEKRYYVLDTPGV